MALISRNVLRFVGWNLTGDLGPWTFYTKPSGTTVFYLKAPPLEPPSGRQITQRWLFGRASATWSQLTPAQRAPWKLAVDRLHLHLTPNGLWTYFQLTHNTAALRTIERQAALSLL